METRHQGNQHVVHLDLAVIGSRHQSLAVVGEGQTADRHGVAILAFQLTGLNVTNIDHAVDGSCCQMSSSRALMNIDMMIDIFPQPRLT